MDNVSSIPAIQFPVIPLGWCPKGTWPEIFNQWQTQFGGQAIVNIPGLAAFDPNAFTQMQTDINNLQNQVAAQQTQINTLNTQVAALTKAYRSGTITSISTGDSNASISFSSAMPSTDYDVDGYFVDQSGSATSAFGWAVVSGTQNTGSITLRFYDIPASVTTFNWWVRQR